MPDDGGQGQNVPKRKGKLRELRVSDSTGQMSVAEITKVLPSILDLRKANRGGCIPENRHRIQNGYIRWLSLNREAFPGAIRAISQQIRW